MENIIDTITNTTDSGLGQNALTQFVVQNNTQHTFFGWIPTTISFAPGMTNDPNEFGVSNRPYRWRVLKKHADNSVALAQIKAPFFLMPGSVEMPVVERMQNTNTYKAAWHQGVIDTLRRNAMVVELMVEGTHCVASPFISATTEVMHATDFSLAVRTRSVFKKTLPESGESHATLTSYITIESDNPIIEITFVIGNDQRDVIVPHGVAVSGFNLITQGRSALYHPESYGGMNEILGDGQTMAFKYFINTDPVNPLMNDTLLAKSKSLFIGTQIYDGMRFNVAFMTGNILPECGFEIGETQSKREAVEAAYRGAVNANAKTPLGFINAAPPSTGNQSDFAGGFPVDVLKALQTHSQALLSRMMTAAMRESWRPSFYWLPNHTRPTVLQYPSLFFWSGRPHFDPSWNRENPEWTTRCGVFFDNFGSWMGGDNQHWGNNHLRAMYELTGDPYLGDICKYYMTLVSWNYLTKWLTHGEAERTARSFKDAYGLASLFRGTPVAQSVFSKLELKGQQYDEEAEGSNATYGIPSVGPADACDPRVIGGSWCPASGNKNVAAMAWQAGFHMEADSLRANPSMVYLDKARLFFLPDGTPKMYINMLDPVNTYSTDGFTAAWLAGWVVMAMKHPTHPNAEFILNVVKPKVEEACGNPADFGPFLSFKMW